MLRFIFSLFLFSLFINIGSSQSKSVVNWSYEVEKISAQEYNLIVKAEIDNKWKLYSQHTDEGGPVPTAFSFDLNKDVELVGVMEESENSKTQFSDLFDLNVKSFVNTATFTQKLKVLKNQSSLKLKIKYMCCDGLRCIPPTEEVLSIQI